MLLSAYLNPNQDTAAFAKVISSKYDIEHILPKQWCNYDGWTNELWEEKLNSFGNLIPLSKRENCSAQHSFFTTKKKVYQKSKIQDALDIAAKEEEWTPKEVAKYQEIKVKRLLDWFGTLGK